MSRDDDEIVLTQIPIDFFGSSAAFVIPIPAAFFLPLDPDGVVKRMGEAAEQWRRETLAGYLKYRRARGEPGTWPKSTDDHS